MNKQQTVLFTGATSGFGKVAALSLAQMGFKIIALIRNEEKGKQLIKEFELKNNEGQGSIELLKGDLTSFESIVKAFNIFQEKYKQLDLLINNAGVWNFERRKSSDKIEETFQVNVLAPMLLIHLFGKLLSKSPNGKTINTSSMLHHGSINFENIEGDGKFKGYDAYRQSKLSVILMTKLLSQKDKKNSLGIYSFHPGFISTDLGRDANFFIRFFFKLAGSSVEKGAQTLIYLAITPKNELVSGAYYANKKVTPSKPESNNLEMAGNLIVLAKKYLSDYITEPSILFSN